MIPVLSTTVTVQPAVPVLVVQQILRSSSNSALIKGVTIDYIAVIPGLSKMESSAITERVKDSVR
jgi:hypothetical protein